MIAACSVLGAQEFTTSIEEQTANRAYDTGLEFYAQGEYTQAVQHLHKAAAQFSKDSHEYSIALLFAADSLLKLQKPQEAIPLLEVLVTSASTEQIYFESIHLLFTAYERTAHYMEITNLYNKIELEELPPQKMFYASLVRARSFAQRGSYEDALEQLQKTEKLLNKIEEDVNFNKEAYEAEIFEWELYCFQELTDYSEVIKLSEKALKSNSINLTEQSLRLYGSSLFKVERFADAARILSDVYNNSQLEQDALDAASSFLRIGEAQKAFGLAFNYKSEEALYLTGLSAVQMGRWSVAERTLTSVYETNSDTTKKAYALYYGTYSAYQMGLYERAVRDFATFTKNYSNNPLYLDAAYYGSLSALQIGDLNQSLVLAQAATRAALSYENKSKTALLLASVYIERTNYIEAERALLPYSKDSTPFAVQALFVLANMYFTIGRNAEADAAWEQVIAKGKTSALAEDASIRRAELAYETKDWNRAFELYNAYRIQYSRGKYSDASLFFGASALNNAGFIDEAVLRWQELLQRFPKSAYSYNARLHLVDAYTQKEDYSLALSTVNEILSLYETDSNTARLQEQVAELELLAAGMDSKLARLLAHYERSQKMDSPQGRAIALDIAQFYTNEQQTREQGVQMLTEVLKKAELPAEQEIAARSSLALGTLYREQGEFKQAAAVLLEAGELYSSINKELTAQSLYGAAESFDRLALFADVRSVYNTMLKTVPDSVWTERTKQLLGE